MFLYTLIMNYQNLAYCRILHVWFFLYLINIIDISPLISIIIISPIHMLNLTNNFMTNSKKFGLVISDISLISILIIYQFCSNIYELYLFENILVFIIYNLYLLIHNYVNKDNINIVNLHMEKLKEDDLQYRNENYFQYIFRVWYEFLYS